MIFAVLLVSIGSVCAADLNDFNANSVDEFLNSGEISVDGSDGVVLDHQSDVDYSVDNNLDSSNYSGSSDPVTLKSSSESSKDISVESIKASNYSSEDISTDSFNASNYSAATVNNSLNNSAITSISASATKYVTLGDVLKVSGEVKSSVEAKHVLPSTVKVGNYTLSIAEYSYLASKAVGLINSGKAVSTKMAVLSLSGRNETYEFNQNIYKADYVTVAGKIVSFMESNKIAPIYVSVNSSKLDYRTYTYGFAKILNYYNSNRAMANYCYFNSSAYNSSGNVTKYVTLGDVLKVSGEVKSSVEAKHVLPSTVKVGNYTLSIAEYSYLASKAVGLINSGKAVSTKMAVLSLSGRNETYEFNQNIYKADYVTVAGKIVSFMESNKIAPIYVSVNSSKLDYRTYTYGFAKILNYYNSNRAMANYCYFNSSAYNSSGNVTKYVTLGELLNAAVSVKSYVEANQALPNTVKVGNYTLNIGDYSYLISKSMAYLNANKSMDTKFKVVSLKSPNVPYTVKKDIYTADYLDMASRIYKYVDNNNNVLPDYASSGSSKVDFRTFTYGFAKIAVFYKNNGYMAKFCTFDSSVFNSIDYKKGINEKNNITNLKPYLTLDPKQDKYAQNTSALRSLAASLTKNCKTDKEKALAIFNYVKNDIDYSFYYDSKGASNAYSTKKANCCDKSNLITSLCRISGIPTRYCHATCSFRSGLVTGHVWVQILIGDTWYVADATSSSNSIGNIANWNINSMTNLKQYVSLPF
ncbi:MAG: transglutaminase-like domain-containing protein [archaeon]|nr:transglutaminase-like domain-containing protein [archaeon]